MSFAALQKVVTYLLAGLGLIALTFGGELTPSVMIGIAIVFVASWFAERPVIDHPLYARVWNAVVVVALGLQIFRGFTGSGGWLALAMEYAALLSLSRLSNRRNAADYQQIAVLAFMHLIAATVLTTDLAYASVFILFVIATPWVLTFAHLRAEIERNYPKVPANEGADVSRVLNSRRIVAPSFLVWTALLSVPMFAMTIALFVVFPRVGLGLVSFGNRNGQNVAGFGNSVELGGFGVIRTDPTVVLRVAPTRGVSTRVMSQYLRLRGTAFDRYDGVRWTRSSESSVPMQAIGDYFPLRRVPDDRKDVTLRIILDRLEEPVLFLPAGTVGVRIPMRGVPGLARRTTVARGHGLDLRYQSPEELGIIYEAVVSTSAHEMDVPVARDMDDNRYTELPKGHERVYALARQLTADIAEPYDKALKLEAFLRNGNRFGYTLKQPATSGKAPLEVFLFEAKRGHCEYFATALAIMLRSVGIASRNVTGFVGGEYNPYAGYFAVRQSDAHSWVEALIPNRGWVTLDPTPPSRDAAGPGASFFADLNKIVDALRAYWMTQVVGYDLRTQIGALKRMREFMREFSFPSLGFKAGSSKARGTERGGSDTVKLAPYMFGVSVIAAVVLFALLYRRFRKKPPGRKLVGSAKRAQAIYQELERVLEKQGVSRPSHLSPEAHARALEEKHFAKAQAVRGITDRYVAARYGGAELAEADLTTMRALLHDIKRAA